MTNTTPPGHVTARALPLTCGSGPVTLGVTQPAPTASGAPGTPLAVGKAATAMAKALFGYVVPPAELPVAEENAVLRARVRRLEQELEQLRAQRDAAIAHELMSMAGDNAEPALA